MNGDSLYIVIPAYNEEENIKNVINDWYPVIEKYGNEDSRLVIIDDGSKDSTYSILKKAMEEKPKLIGLTKANGGHGSTILYGYHYALDNNADFVFQTDSDGQTLPSEFEPFWNERNNFDLVIGNRNKREDGFSRVVVTKTLKLVIKIAFGESLTDANTPYRLMESSVLRKNIKHVPDDFFLSNVLLAVIYKRNNQRIKFIPITFRPRQGGVNSINLKRITGIGIQALKDFRKLNKEI
ncbi:MAG: glycosyltransferase family 2 protein [Butyrivibrio sp.]|nr:glycosyltransferase family 2 protein [Butyrivibrio sp.]